MKYISIDGDDVGRKITHCYLSNNLENLQAVSNNLEKSTNDISKFLLSRGLKVLFCAADGIVASTDVNIDFSELFKGINKLAPENISFSAGVGNNLREAYIALLAAKSNGKNCLYKYSDIDLIKM